MTKDLVTSCCGRPIADCPGCPERMTLVNKEVYMNNIDTIAKRIGIDWTKVEFTKDQFEKGLDTEMKEHHNNPETKVIDTKEEAAKVALAHLQEDPKYYTKLQKMEESTYLSTILLKIEDKTVNIADFDRLIKEATPASVIDRVRRKINPNNRMNRRGHDKSGHTSGLPKIAARVNPTRKRSNRTQMQHGGRQGHRRSVRTQRRDRIHDKIGEAIDFIIKNIGQDIHENKLKQLPNLELLKEIAVRLMSKPHVNRDWLQNFIIKVENVRYR